VYTPNTFSFPVSEIVQGQQPLATLPAKLAC